MSKRSPSWPAALFGTSLIAAAAAFRAPRVRAESPDLVVVQVRLLQGGAPVNLELDDVTFELYDVSSGGSPLWFETQDDVQVRNGILSAKLGAQTPLGNVFKSGLGTTPDRWVAIRQNGDELVPRFQLTAVPYAQGAGAATVASQLWNDDTKTAMVFTALAGELAASSGGLEASGGKLQLAAATAGGGLDLTGGVLSINAGAGIAVAGDQVAVDPTGLVAGAAAEVEGDRLKIDYMPNNYSKSAPGGYSTDELVAHLKGIDDELAGGGGGGGSVDAVSLPAGGRLSLSSSASVTVSDTTGSTVYYVPHVHNRIALYDGSDWVVRNFGTGVSVVLSSTSTSTNYDVFAYWNTSATAVQLYVDDWSGTRSNDVSQKDGVHVRGATGSQTATHRYVGTIRTTSTSNTTADTHAQRFVWNQDNRVASVQVGYDSNFSGWTLSGTVSNRGGPRRRRPRGPAVRARPAPQPHRHRGGQ